MKNLRLIFLLFAALAAGPLLPAAEPKNTLEATVDAALNAIYGDCCKDLSAEEKRAKVRGIIEANYDFDVIIRRAMGRNWRLLEPDQRDRVLDLIKRLVVKAYVDGLENHSRPGVSFGETIMITDNRAEIPSTVSLSNETVRVVYRFGRLKSGWQLFDIVAEDISMVSNFREQFDAHFRKSDGEALIGKLQELLKKENLDEEVTL